jgi:UDP:flavonoid glycosyltransferase YjiC (YdhE family)
MRVLFTTQAGAGTFHPLVPLAHALTAAGHEVAFACSRPFCVTVEAAGFRAYPAGFDAAGRSLPDFLPEIRGMAVDEQNDYVYQRWFAGITAEAMVPDLLALARSWCPDVLVRDTTEFGGCVAAEVLGLPHASVRSSSLASAYARRHVVREPLERLRTAHGLASDPDMAMLFRYLHLAFEPPGFRPPGEPAAPTAHLLRPVATDPDGDEAVPARVGQLRRQPTVYVTLGTVPEWNRVSGLFPTILAALRDEPLNVIATVGRNQDPAAFGPQPPHVRIERYIPQRLLLPYCNLMIAHGGFNTVLGALSAGVPLVILPVSADQPMNARSCATLGVAKVVGPEDRTPATIREAVREVLDDAGYRQRARRLVAAIQTLPGPEHGVALLERLATERRPLPAAR